MSIQGYVRWHLPAAKGGVSHWETREIKSLLLQSAIQHYHTRFTIPPPISPSLPLNSTHSLHFKFSKYQPTFSRMNHPSFTYCRASGLQLAGHSTPTSSFICFLYLADKASPFTGLRVATVHTSVSDAGKKLNCKASEKQSVEVLWVLRGQQRPSNTPVTPEPAIPLTWAYLPISPPAHNLLLPSFPALFMSVCFCLPDPEPDSGFALSLIRFACLVWYLTLACFWKWPWTFIIPVICICLWV